MTADDSHGIDDAAGVEPELVRLAKIEQRDPVADLLRANLRRALVGVDEPPRIGRFTTLHVIGRGAMGTVLAAWDPVLDRKVALKVLRDAGASKAELLREARALARLTHPHVVTVFEADEIDGRIVIAMQFVHGADLRTWLREAPRSGTEVVPMFAAIARGLAAAHRAGVVHGDLKPENVLVGDDGVRIADFGTARVLADAGAASYGGTPEYLAPERRAGAPASVAADQFAFAVSLHEALFAERPTPGAIVDAGVVPRRVVAVIQRGLAEDPAQRWPDMDAIAAELERRDRHGQWLLGSVAAAAIVAATWFAASGERDVCAGGDASARELWNEGAAGRVRAVFSASAAPHAEAVAARVDELLGQRRDQWAAAHREVCLATRVRAEQSDSLHDLRMRCLERRASEMRALVDAFVDAEQAPAIDDAITAVDDLPELARCDPERVQGDSDYSLPEDPRAQRAIVDARVEIDRAWAAYSLARYDDALARAQELATAADRFAFAPLQAEALLLLGAAQARRSAPGVAEPTLRRARLLAAEIGNDRLAAEIMVRWLRTVMFAGELARAEELAEHARAAALRAGTGTAEIDAILGEARLQAGDADGALAVLDAALATETRADRRALVLVNLGSARLALGDAAPALRLYEEALAIATAHFGAGHPSLGFYEHRVGRGLRAVGRLDEAIATLERVLAARQTTLGANDRAIASVLADLAATEHEIGRLDDAAEHQRRAIAIRSREYGPLHARLADLHAGLADIERDRGRARDALEHYRRALQIREATPEHPQVAVLRARIAELGG
ncbi:MAG TPA: serine/threonine-protein kinase [Nannocystaceae bacterium]|nr:serine/threonine-protein kinase [Nannocystaceae bacterium]